ncbi:MAG TPA: rhomboid family intramembrane serine protease [Puia sp.]|nr:rhomboid family intramembrane serine protease [Puia sp.]
MTIAETDQSVVPPVPPAPSAPPAPPRKRDTIFSVFDPKGKHLITAIIIGLNVLVFIAMAISGVNLMEPTSENLLKWGANFRPFTLQGEWWRLLTCCFLHIGIFHLLINMYALLYIGIMLEPLLGRTRYLVAYLLTGLLSSVASLAWNAYTVSAGASGAIFGVYGVFLALLTMPHLIHPQIRKPLLKSMGWFVVLNLGIGVTGIVDAAGHAGGLVSGLLMGYTYYPSLRKPWNSSLRYLTIVVAIIAAIGLSFFIYHKVPDDIVRYDQKMKIFASRDSLAIATFNQLADLPKGKERDDLEAKGIQYFQQNMALLSDAANLRLPPVLQERNRKMIKYCMSQITYHQLQVKSLDGDAPGPDGGIKKQLEFYSRQLDTLNKELGEDDK